MAKILVAGLVNVETTLKVRQFPVEYYPIATDLHVLSDLYDDYNREFLQYADI